MNITTGMVGDARFAARIGAVPESHDQFDIATDKVLRKLIQAASVCLRQSAIRS